MKPLDLARLLAEPVLLGRGLVPWTSGHDALVAARLLAETRARASRSPKEPRARRWPAALARTLAALRRAGIAPPRVAALAEAKDATADDARRLTALARLYAAYEERLEGRVADPVTLIAAAREGLERARWLDGAYVLIVDDLELEPDEIELVEALAARVPVRVLRRPLPPSLRQYSFRGLLAEHGVREVAWTETPLAAAAPPGRRRRSRACATALFEPPRAIPRPRTTRLELLTAPGEAAEVRAIVRRLLREAARGVPFEEMGVVLPRPETYAPLFTDLLTRLGIPHRLHPSLPLRFGRAARSLLLLFRCRGLERRGGDGVPDLRARSPSRRCSAPTRRAQPARWDADQPRRRHRLRLDRWMVGLRAYAEHEREAAEARARPGAPRARGCAARGRGGAAARWSSCSGRDARRARGRGDLGRVGRAPAARVVDQWIGAERDREAVRERDRRPGRARRPSRRARRGARSSSVLRGALRVGAPAARAASTGGRGPRGRAGRDGGPALPRGRHPRARRGRLPRRRSGPIRSCSTRSARRSSRRAGARPRRSPRRRAADAAKPPSSTLFDDSSASPVRRPRRRPSTAASPACSRPRRTACSRRAALFHRAVAPGHRAADPLLPARRRAQRTRAAAVALLRGRGRGARGARRSAGAELDRDGAPRTIRDDAAARGRARRRRARPAARAARRRRRPTAIAAGSPSSSSRASRAQARWSSQLTRYDGLVADAAGASSRARLDPLDGAPRRLGQPARALRALRLPVPAPVRAAPASRRAEPEERTAPRAARARQPLPRGGRALPARAPRPRRAAGRATRRDARAPAREMADEALDGPGGGQPAALHRCSGSASARASTTRCWRWLEREAAQRRPRDAGALRGGLRPAREPPARASRTDPSRSSIDLGDGRVLRVSGKIDRIDRRADGGLVLRDYKTGRAPRDDGGVFRGGEQLQIPFYVLAAAQLFPGERVVEAFLDYVDGGRQVAFDPAARHAATPSAALLRELVDAIGAGRLRAGADGLRAGATSRSCAGRRRCCERRRALQAAATRACSAYLRLRDS